MTPMTWTLLQIMWCSWQCYAMLWHFIDDLLEESPEQWLDQQFWSQWAWRDVLNSNSRKKRWLKPNRRHDECPRQLDLLRSFWRMSCAQHFTYYSCTSIDLQSFSDLATLTQPSSMVMPPCAHKLAFSPVPNHRYMCALPTSVLLFQNQTVVSGIPDTYRRLIGTV